MLGGIGRRLRAVTPLLVTLSTLANPTAVAGAYAVGWSANAVQALANNKKTKATGPAGFSSAEPALPAPAPFYKPGPWLPRGPPLDEDDEAERYAARAKLPSELGLLDRIAQLHEDSLWDLVRRQGGDFSGVLQQLRKKHRPTAGMIKRSLQAYNPYDPDNDLYQLRGASDTAEERVVLPRWVPA